MSPRVGRGGAVRNQVVLTSEEEKNTFQPNEGKNCKAFVGGRRSVKAVKS